MHALDIPKGINVHRYIDKRISKLEREKTRFRQIVVPQLIISIYI